MMMKILFYKKLYLVEKTIEGEHFLFLYKSLKTTWFFVVIIIRLLQGIVHALTSLTSQLWSIKKDEEENVYKK